MKLLDQEIMNLFLCFGRTCDEHTLLAWIEVLKQYPLQKICLAIDKFKKSNDSFPTTGKIINLAMSDKKTNGWFSALHSAQNGGRNPITARVAKTLNTMGGIIRLMDATDHELPWLKKEFDQIYPTIPETINISEVRCYGLEAEILPDEIEKGDLLLE